MYQGSVWQWFGLLHRPLRTVGSVENRGVRSEEIGLWSVDGSVEDGVFYSSGLFGHQPRSSRGAYIHWHYSQQFTSHVGFNV